jgi:hypothetical protein
MRKRRAIADNGLSTGLGTTITHVQSTASSAAGNGLDTTIKSL